MGRVKYAAKNITFGWIGNITTLLLGALLRQTFIHHLGDALLGVNDYYTNILTVLSLAELGIGTAFNFSLYGPVARNEVEKVKSYMGLYKKAYRTIAKHLFRAHRKYEGGRTLIILADNLEEATEKAVEVFGLDSVHVKRIDPTDDPQVYEI